MIAQALKEGHEDKKKMQEFENVNMAETPVYNYGRLGFENTKWADIKVGDMVTVWNNEEFPADIMLINCPGEAALIDTTNIDGEIIVKEKYPFVPDYNPEKYQFFNGVIKCQEP